MDEKDQSVGSTDEANTGGTSAQGDGDQGGEPAGSGDKSSDAPAQDAAGESDS